MPSKAILNSQDIERKLYNKCSHSYANEQIVQMQCFISPRFKPGSGADPRDGHEHRPGTPKLLLPTSILVQLFCDSTDCLCKLPGPIF